MGDYGIRVSPPGQNVLTATDKVVTFTSKYPTLKLYKWDTVTFTTSGDGDYTYEIAHDLGYAPAFDVFVKSTASFPFLTATTYPNAWFNIGGANRWFEQNEAGGLYAYSDSTKLYIQAKGVFKGDTITAKYYLFVDPIQEFSSASNI
jgi:hypothetical protein